MTDLYQILGVDRGATQGDIKQSYRNLAKRAHPDAGGSEGEFEAIKLAYDVLSDGERRARYDASGETDEPQIIDERGRMYAALAGMVFDAIQQMDPDTHDIVAAVRKRIKDESQKCSADIERMKKLKTVAEKAARRIVSLGDQNQLKMAVEARINALVEQMKQTEEMIAFGERMQLFLDAYGYEADVPQGVWFNHAFGASQMLYNQGQI